MIKKYIKNMFYKLVITIIKKSQDYENNLIKEKYNFDKTVRISNTTIVGNVFIDKHSYINEGGTLTTGIKSKINIGKHCAIGRNVHITAKGHSLNIPTSDEKYQIHEHIERDTIIGDYVWIGDGVFIKHGVKIGNFAIVGANSVIVKDVNDFEIVGGVPAKHIRYNSDHYKYGNIK